MPSNTYYQTQGGALPIDAPSYVLRQADEDLYQFAYSTNPRDLISYVLAPRQMGKSSLKVRTANRLAQDDFLCIMLDLQVGFDTDLSEEKFYKNILYLIYQQLPKKFKDIIKQNWDQHWESHPDILPAIKFRECLAEIALPRFSGRPVIIFIDEIQKLVHWKIHNSFLGLLRAWADQSSVFDPSEATDPEEKVKSRTESPIKFVLLGVIKPYDLLVDGAFNIARSVELQNLKDNTNPLLKGLENVTENPEHLLKSIIRWTGGSPFLTQLVCHEASQNQEICSDASSQNLDSRVEEFIHSKIIENWRSHDAQRQNHFSEVERWFTQGYTDKEERLKALQLYASILKNKRKTEFRSDRPEQMNLLMSGLVKRVDQWIDTANPIYQEIFDLRWSKSIQEFLTTGDVMASILNRQVYVLVDRSASMDRADKKENNSDENKQRTRWQRMPELLEGDLKNIFRDRDDRKICDRLDLYLFSRNRVGQKFEIYASSDEGTSPSELQVNVFDENFPDSNTYIVPTLERCKQDWMNGGRKEGKSAFIIIYTDGMLDDRPQFEIWVSQTCKELENQNELKIIMLGLGDDVAINPLPFLDLDFNVRGNFDKNEKPCNILTFDLVDEIEDIVDVLKRQIESDPNDLEEMVPAWVKERFPEWYKKRLAASSS